MMNVTKFWQDLPANATVEFVDGESHPLDVTILRWQDFDGCHKVTVKLRVNIPADKLSNVYDLRILEGIKELTLNWAVRKADFYEYACSQSYDKRWQDPEFREHMFANYINTERPITDQLYNLDDGNLIVLLRYINNKLERYIRTRYIYCGADMAMSLINFSEDSQEEEAPPFDNGR